MSIFIQQKAKEVTLLPSKKRIYAAIMENAKQIDN